MPVWQQLAAAIIGSGIVTTFITSFASRKKSAADATATNVTSILEVDARLAERLVSLEKRVAVVEKENYELKNEVFTLRCENRTVMQENRLLREENDALRAENEILKETNYELMERLGETE